MRNRQQDTLAREQPSSPPAGVSQGRSGLWCAAGLLMLAAKACSCSSNSTGRGFARTLCGPMRYRRGMKLPSERNATEKTPKFLK